MKAGDVVMWLLAAASVALGVLGLIKGDTTAAKVISVLAILPFIGVLVVVMVWRHEASKYNYKTFAGLPVREGVKNHPDASLVNVWVAGVATFWSKHYEPTKVLNALGNSFLVLFDKEKISVMGRWVRGYTLGHTAVAGYRVAADGKPDWGYVAALVRHELSHVILEAVAPGMSEAEQHELFKKKGLGA